MSDSSNSSSTHELNRSKVCALCGSKANNARKITQRQSISIQELCNSRFNLENAQFPNVMCNTCRLVLSQHSQGEVSRDLPEMPEYEKILLLKTLRGNTDITCNCYICLTARQRGNIKHNNRGRGKKRSLSPTIKEGLIAAKDDVLPSEHKLKVKSTYTICQKCHLHIGQGVKHKCTTGQASENILNNISNLPEKVSEQIASALLKRKADKENISGSKSNIDIELSTKGRKAKVTINPEPKTSINISHERLHDLQVGLGIPSNTKMKVVSNWIRTELGRKSIPANYNNSLSEKSNFLSDDFSIKEEEFDGPGDTGKVQRPVIYADSERLIDKIITERQYTGTPRIIIMVDGGGEFFKVCATILPENYDWKTGRETVNDSEYDEQEGEQMRGRSTYAEGGSTKKGKPSGVKRVILLAVVPDIKETYSNVSLIFELINLNRLHFKIVADFKLQLIVLGLQTATATHPCGYCLISKQDLQQRNVDFTAKERTFGSLKDSNKQFLDNGGEVKDSKFFYNCLNPSLLEESDNMRVIEKFIIPELHLILGFVSLIMKSLENMVGKERAMLWPSKLHLVAKGYQGGTLEGNACRKLLKQADRILDPEVLGNVPSLMVQPIVHAVKCMDKLVTASFSTDIITEDLDPLINDLTKAVLATDMHMTLKMHVILSHLIPTLRLDYFQKRGLGVCTEQAGESIHAYFRDHFWKPIQISKVDHPDYAKQLKKAVVKCASFAI